MLFILFLGALMVNSCIAGIGIAAGSLLVSAFSGVVALLFAWCLTDLYNDASKTR